MTSMDDRIDALDSCTNINTNKYCFGLYNWNEDCKYKRIIKQQTNKSYYFPSIINFL